MNAANRRMKEQNEELNQLLQKHALPLSEVHHRVKNNLQNIISLIFFQKEKLKDNESKKYLESLSNKIQSIALIHDHLYNNENFDKINVRQYISTLYEYFDNLDYMDDQMTMKLDVDIDNLNLETMIPLGLITAELISNSMKCARLPDGNLKISLSVLKSDSKSLNYSYSDNDPGYNIDDPLHEKSGLGTLVITSMVRQLDSSFGISNNDKFLFEVQFSSKVASTI